jgi:hypothetical protein
MTILFDSRRPVNPGRSFGVGITPPDPGPPDPDAVADAAPDGDVECDPAHWPAWTDYHRYAPSPDDRAWWAAEIERLESARIDRDADRRAAESDATDALTRGLIPRDLAAEIMRTSNLGHDA